MKPSDVVFALLGVALVATGLLAFTADINSAYDSSYLEEMQGAQGVTTTANQISDLVESDQLSMANYAEFVFGISKITYLTGKLILQSTGMLTDLIAHTFSEATGIAVPGSMVGIIIATVTFSVVVAFLSSINRGDV